MPQETAQIEESVKSMKAAESAMATATERLTAQVHQLETIEARLNNRIAQLQLDMEQLKREHRRELDRLHDGLTDVGRQISNLEK